MRVSRLFNLMARPRKSLADVHRRINYLRHNGYLRRVNGVIHVGANVGQERELYHDYNLSVLWIEPIPSVFDQLKENIALLPNQECVRALVADTDGQELTFHIANNNGESSSILELADHRDIWPDVQFVKDMELRSVTLPTLLKTESIDPKKFDALVLDTQGSELLILKGARLLLPGLRYIKTEVADFESYAGCARLEDMTKFLSQHGFREWRLAVFAERQRGGRYYEVVYRRVP